MAEEKTSTQSVLANGLIILHNLLKETGASDNILLMTKQKPSKQRKRIAHNSLYEKDCLMNDPKEGMHLVTTMGRTIRADSHVKGAIICGKDRSEHQYLGKGFQIPPGESPGPAYSCVSTLDTTHGQSFPKAERMPTEKKPNNRGPDYLPKPMVGRQIESIHDNMKNVIFTKGKRFNDKEFISKQHCKGVTSLESPPPTAYQTMSSTNRGNGVTICRARRAVSATLPPRMVYSGVKSTTEEIEEKNIPVFAAYSSIHTNAPSFSIPKNTCSGRNSVLTQSHEVSPGPGYYDPKYSVTEIPGPKVSFKKDGLRVDTKREEDKPETPGLIYNIEPYVNNKHVPALYFGKASEGNARFVDNQYLGKYFSTFIGSISPGPKYILPECPKGIAVSFAAKMKTPMPKVRKGTCQTI